MKFKEQSCVVEFINASGNMFFPLSIIHTHVLNHDSDRSCFFSACREYSNEIPVRVNPFIIDGEDAEAGDFPHMVSKSSSRLRSS